MPTPLQTYLTRIEKEYKTGLTTENSLRPALVDLLASLPELNHFRVINEPKRIACGAPDIVLLNKENAPLIYIETKDIGDTDLQGEKQNKEQFDRYKQGLDCVVFTDFLRFSLYQAGECLLEISLALLNANLLTPLSDAQAKLDDLLQHLRDIQPIPIKSPKRLALIMAGKAQLLARSIQVVLKDATSEAGYDLHQQLLRMKSVLMSNVAHAEFADWYAQTLIYGLFAARYHDAQHETFSRKEAAELIPKSNPFLRKLFQRIGVYDLDVRVAWIIDDLVAIFGVTDVRTLLDANKEERDPVMLFYEDFLTAYDPNRRKARGVYYTPAPVVTFIVRAVDELLQKAFDLKEGLADYSLTPDGKHRLQILDPATGTGTFLVEVVRKIYSKFAGQTGIWNDYVRDHLLPRLHGYEILMAPYAMAHLNLEHVFQETGATNLDDARYGIYLTNTLEDAHFDGNLFSPIDLEAKAVSLLKQNMHVMVMIGNPPYNVSSSNKGEWIEGLVQSYKKGLEEQNIQPLSDDYIKFIRYAQWQIERTGEGIIGFITNNSFLEGVIHRTMRAELLRVFEEIYILNLHGNSRLKEKTPQGGKDENVFDIQQGVSILLLIRRKEGTKRAARLHYTELYGSRKEKLDALQKLSLQSAEWKKLTPTKPYHFFVPKDFTVQKVYKKGFSLTELFTHYNSGASTSRDRLIVQSKKEEVSRLLEEIRTQTIDNLRSNYNLGLDTRNWKVANAQADAKSPELTVLEYAYRPFDICFVPYSGASRGLWAYPCFRTLGALLHPLNYALCATRFVTAFDAFYHCRVSATLVDKCFVSNLPSESTYAFPLYKLPEGWDYTPAELAAGKTRKGMPIPLELNMRTEILKEISEAVGERVTGEEVFDYVYGILHDPEYRSQYFEFLKIDYPRIPYPKDLAEYRSFAERGARLRRLHLMDETLELPKVATFEVAGSNQVMTVRYEEISVSEGKAPEGRVWINETQYFDHVPRHVWDHYVGAYQPARLWLQKRVGRKLDFDDVRWYLRMCATIAEERGVYKSPII